MEVVCVTRLLSAATGLFGHLLSLSCERNDYVMQRSLLWRAGWRQRPVSATASVCLAGGVSRDSRLVNSGLDSLEVPPALKIPPPSARAREAILLPTARLTLLSGTKYL